MTAPTVTPLPTPPSRQEPDTFSDRSDAFLGALPTFQSELNALGTYVETEAADVATDAAAAAASATAAAASATAASQVASAWVSGASYDVGDVVYSPIDYSTYRAITTHSGVTTDPSADTTNWVNISGANSLSDFGITATTAELNILDGVTASTAELNILDGVTATTAELNYVDVTTLGTSEASKAVTTDANGVTIFDGGVVEDDTTITSSAGAATINCRDGNVFSHTLTEDVTYTFSNAPASGRAFGFTLKVVQDSTARTITWPASVDWPAATAPTLSTGSGEVDVFVFFTTDGGTTWYGFTAGQVLS